MCWQSKAINEWACKICNEQRANAACSCSSGFRSYRAKTQDGRQDLASERAFNSVASEPSLRNKQHRAQLDHRVLPWLWRTIMLNKLTSSPPSCWRETLMTDFLSHGKSILCTNDGDNLRCNSLWLIPEARKNGPAFFIKTPWITSQSFVFYQV